MKLKRLSCAVLICSTAVLVLAACTGSIFSKEKDESTVSWPAAVPTDAPVNNPDLPPEKHDADSVNWNDLYELQWTFHSEMRHNYIVGKAGNIILVYGHDGGISGYHEHEYLYGIDSDTGEKIWEVYGGYLGIFYAWSESGHIFTVVKTHDESIPKFTRRDINTGEIQFDYELTEYKTYTPVYLSLGKAAAVLLSGRDDSYLLVFEKDSGVLLWMKNFEKGTYLVDCSGNITGIIVRQPDRLEAFDWIYGNTLWSVQDRKQSMGFYPDYGVMKTPEDFHGINMRTKKWFAFEDEFKLVDLKSGQVLHSVSKEGRVMRLMPLNYEYIVLLEYNSEDKSFITPIKFSLYSVTGSKVVWTKNEDIYRVLIYNNTLYYVNASEIKSVDLLTGNVKWSTPLLTNIDKNPYMDSFLVQPLMLEDMLVTAEDGVIHILDPDTGKRMFHVGDYSIDDYILGGDMNSFCSIVLLDDSLYIGSRGGNISRLKIKR